MTNMTNNQKKIGVLSLALIWSVVFFIVFLGYRLAEETAQLVETTLQQRSMVDAKRQELADANNRLIEAQQSAITEQAKQIAAYESLIKVLEERVELQERLIDGIDGRGAQFSPGLKFDDGSRWGGPPTVLTCVGGMSGLSSGLITNSVPCIIDLPEGSGSYFATPVVK